MLPYWCCNGFVLLLAWILVLCPFICAKLRKCMSATKALLCESQKKRVQT